MRLNARIWLSGKKWLSWGILLLLLLFAVSLVSSLIELMGAGSRVSEAESEILALSEQNRELKETASRVQTPEYEDFLIRDELGWVKPGEVVAMMPEKELGEEAEVVVEEDGQQGSENWQKWVELFL